MFEVVDLSLLNGGLEGGEGRRLLRLRTDAVIVPKIDIHLYNQVMVMMV